MEFKLSFKPFSDKEKEGDYFKYWKCAYCKKHAGGQVFCHVYVTPDDDLPERKEPRVVYSGLICDLKKHPANQVIQTLTDQGLFAPYWFILRRGAVLNPLFRFLVFTGERWSSSSFSTSFSTIKDVKEYVGLSDFRLPNSPHSSNFMEVFDCEKRKFYGPILSKTNIDELFEKITQEEMR